MADGAAASELRFLTFRIAEQLYALPAQEVSEVIRLPAVARVPQGPRALLGLGNLRGAVLPIASARGLLGKPDAEAARAVVLNGAAAVALAVDRVEALVSVDAESVDTDQAVLASDPGERLRGAFQLPGGGEVAKILDLWPLLEAAFVQAPRASRASARAADLHMAESAAAATDVLRLVTFDVAGQEFALPLDEVVEIVPPPEALAAVPRAEALVLGVTAYRDVLLSLLSLRGLLGLPMPAASTGREKVLVISIGGALAGLVVDGVRAIVAAPQSLVEPTPAMLAARTAGETRIKSIYRGEGGRRLISILSKDQLFREDVMQQLGQGRVAPAAAATEQTGEQTLRFLVFRLGDDEFGLPIDTVDEVARVPEQITHVPKTPAFLEGVINLRGEVLPVVDQRRRFDMPPAPNQDARRLVIVRAGVHRAGLIVDSVSEVLRSSDAAIEPAPDLTGEANRLVQGVINLEDAGRLVLLLDPGELLSRAERGLLDAFQADARQAEA